MVSYKGFNQGVLTFKSSGAKTGAPVSIDMNGNVVNAINGNEFVGICVGVHDGYAAVQISGYAEIKYSGSISASGYVALVSDGKNGVKSSTTNIARYKMIKNDTENSVVGFIL